MFNSRGGYSGQRPMGMHRMNQPGMNQPGMNQPGMNLPRMGMSSMNMSGMGMSSMGMSSMNQTNLNLSSMSTPVMNSGLSQPHMGLSGMNSSLGLNNMNQSGVNVYRMGPPGMNQGGLGFQSEMKSQGFSMRPMDSPGSFLGNSDPMGMKNMPLRQSMHTSPERLMGPQSMPRFPSPSGPVPPGQPRMHPQNQEMPPLINRGLTHPSDHLRGNPKPPLQEPPHHMKEKPLGALGVFGRLSQEMGMKSGPSSMDQMPGPKNRYTNESASSILSSFGLSNEDLEELSRYPDEELTPGNLPNILRDIRLRKINRPGPSHDQGGGGRRPGGEVVPSKVIDYGHSSKFPYSDNSVSSRPFESSRAVRKSSPISKQPAPPSANTEQDSDNSMLNQIPTLCGRKASLPASKQDRSNNKTLVGEPSKMPSDGSVNVPKPESAVITIQPDSTPLCDIPVILDTDLTTEAPMGSIVDQVNYPPPVEAAPPGKANWSSPMSQEEMQKMKKLPTPSMMNDYFAASPRIFPHICSLCNLECRHIKDWVKHQNNSSHIENCRTLRQQYPDWNPQVHTLRDDGKEGTTPKRSRSKSGSPRRSRRSGSRHRTRRSNSPRSGKRSRSRSPRRVRRSPMRSRSPRRNTRSPQRSLSPSKQRRARSASTPDKRAVDAAVQKFIESNKVKSGEKERPAKPASNGKALPAKSTSSSSVKGRKPSESTSSSTKNPSSSSSSSSAKKPSSTSSPSRSVRKPSSTTSPSRSVRKPSGTTSPSRSAKKPSSTSSPSRSVRKPSGTTSPSRSAKKPSSTSSPSRSVRKPSSTSSPSSSSRKPPTSSSSSSVKKPASNSSNSSSNNAPRKPLPPKPGPGPSAPKKPVVSTGAKKTTPATTAGKRPPLSKQPATQKAPSTQKPPEPFNALNKFLFAKGGSEKVIHVTNLPDSGYTDQDILKIVQPFGKVSDILIVRSKNEAFLETNFREAATAAVKFSETVPVVINHKRVTLSLVGQNKEQAKTEVESSNDNRANEQPLPEIVNEENQLKEEEKKEDKVEKEEPKEAKEEKKTEKEKVKPVLDLPPGFVKRYRLIDPPLTDSEKCVVVISNLPEKQYTEEEISNLAKPFGGANDTLIISTHRKAYLELSNRNSVDSMMKFYSVFPTFLGGNSLNIAMSSRYKDVKDENRIFAEILEQAPYKIAPSIYEKFVHLSNLPEKEIDEFEIARFGLRFGKVEHYMIISNKKKAILHMNSASAAKTMKNFLTRYPVNIDENILSCTLANKKSMAEDEYESYLEEEKSSEPETNMFEGEVAPTADEVKKVDPRDSLPTSPVSEMDTDETANPGEACEEEDEDEEEEEAAEAPEAPEGSSVFIQPQPVEHQQEYNKVPQSYTSEEMDVLVSVESDEEEYDTQDSQNQRDMASLLTAEESEEHDSEMETSKDSRSKPASSQGKEPHLRGGSTSEKERKSESEGNEEESAAQVPENATKVSGSTDKKGTSNKSGDRRERDTKHSSHSSSRYGRSSDDKSRSYEDRSRSRNESSRHSGGSKERDHTAADGTRTAKYNPQKGDICVTLTVDGQKSSRTPDPRKRSSGEGASSGRESSTPKSSSNRSSPSENAAGNHKSSSGAHQSKSSHRSTSSQDKDSKVASRSRENDSRSSGRKDDRSKDSSSSSSSRHTRSTRASTRGQRSKEDEKEDFPFNLDEFVTVDEIVEDRGTSQKTNAGAADAAKSGKRKETATPTSDSKKAKQDSTTAAQDLSFVTLDEVGDEEDAATAAETSQGKDAQSLVTTDAEDAPLASAKDSEMLMTLDEVSDEEDAQAAAAEHHSSTVPDILAKDQLLTLDEVCAEDEEQASPSEPHSSANKLPQDTANKQGSSIALKAKKNQKALNNSVSELGQDSQADQSLLTLDEVKGEDEDECPGDAELQFLTVDEIGEEEEEAAEQTENDGKSQPSKRITKSQPAAKTPAGQRVGLRKRPLPEDSKEASQQSPADSTTGNQPAKAKTTIGKMENSINSTPDKTETGDAESKGQETPAKKSKLESPAKEKLGPFNSSVAVGMEYLVPKTGFFCELCSLFYMDDASKLKHCKSLRHYQAVQKQLTKEEESAEGKTPST
ncbi:zinc finger protein 638 isoform X2 [Hyperolius riggenbachi]